MRSLTDADPYLSARGFAIEQTEIFGTYWIFATLAFPLARPFDFVVREIAGQSVVIQNIEGELIAYENSCPHRRMQIQTETSGRRPMVCQFHGWSFKKDGRPNAIPHYDDMYQYSAEALKRVCLKMFAVEVVGEFVFVNLSANPIRIQEQFSYPLLHALKKISAKMGDEVIQTSVDVKANWKLPIEVLYDPNHVQFLHGKSLGRARRPLYPGRPATAFTSYEDKVGSYGLPKSVKEFSYYAEADQEIPREDWFDLVDRYEIPESAYLDILLFPNTHVALSTAGRTFAIEQYCPTGHDECINQMSIVMGRANAGCEEQLAARATSILLERVRWRQPSLVEDHFAAERVQIAMSRNPECQLGVYERLTVHFRNWMRNHYERTIHD